MNTLYRWIGEESGIALPLAIMVMVLVGVMGAGMLTLVMTDLNSAVTSNQGQRAFEMADAGVAVAKQQLLSEPTAAKYDGEESDDLRWAISQDGVTLNNLDENDATADSVLVEIENLGSPENSFKVISTGRYGDARRKVEAIFYVPGGSGDDPDGNLDGGIELRGWRELYE